MMARPKRNTNRENQESQPVGDEQRQFAGFFTVAYVLDALDLLNSEKKAKLDSLVDEGIPDWRTAVEGEYGINRTFIRSVYSLCTELHPPTDAVVFILRGLGCPDFQERLMELVD